MAIEYVGGTTSSGNSTANVLDLTALTGGLASSPSTGDLVLVVTGFTSTVDESPGVSTAGYTGIADLWSNDNFDTNLYAGWKVMGASPDSNITCNPSSAVNLGATSVCQVWRGVDVSTPMDVSVVTRTLTNNSNPGCLAITPTTAGAVVIEAGIGSSASALTITQSGGTIFTNFLTTSTDPGTASTVAIDSYSGWTSGAVSPSGWIGWSTTSTDSSCGVTIALRPASSSNTTNFFNFI